jgi:hydrogenase maturation factor
MPASPPAEGRILRENDRPTRAAVLTGNIQTDNDARRIARAGFEDARVIVEVHDQPTRAVLATTRYGGTRIVDMLVGDPLSRIC